jgi:hypothetical protein
LLYDAIFKAVKGNDSQTTTGLQHALCSFQSVGQLVQFAVHMNADGLKRPSCGVFRRAGLMANGLADDCSELRSCCDRTRSHNRTRDTA